RAGIAGNRGRHGLGQFGWLRHYCPGSNARRRSFSRRCAVVDHEENQDEKEYPNRTREVPLIEISHMGPGSPSFTAIRKNRLQVVLSMRDRLYSRPNRSLLLKKRDERERPEKEKKQRSKAPDGARIEKHFPERHDDHEHRYDRGYAE